MKRNQNEECLLKYISHANENIERTQNIMDIIIQFGIKLKFKNHNPVYQIIDELTYSNII